MLHELVRELLRPFLRGETSVVDLTLAFNGTVGQISQERPLRGQEVDLYVALEEWYEAGWVDRPAAVERLRALATSIMAA